MMKNLSSNYFKKVGGPENEPLFSVGNDDLPRLIEDIKRLRSSDYGNPDLIEYINAKIIQQDILPKPVIIISVRLRTSILNT